MLLQMQRIDPNSQITMSWSPIIVPPMVRISIAKLWFGTYEVRPDLVSKAVMACTSSMLCPTRHLPIPQNLTVPWTIAVLRKLKHFMSSATERPESLIATADHCAIPDTQILGQPTAPAIWIYAVLEVVRSVKNAGHRASAQTVQNL
jgi:hypothetical protein